MIFKQLNRLSRLSVLSSFRPSRRAAILAFFTSLLGSELLKKSVRPTGASAATPPAMALVTGTKTPNSFGAAAAPLSALPMREVQAWPSSSIIVDKRNRFQEFVGFGGAFTESACWSMINILSTAQCEALFTETFSNNGLSMIRVPMTDADFTSHTVLTTLDDVADDTTMAYFSIAQQVPCILPKLIQALSKNPHLKIIGSPWSPPAWMKTNAALIGSTGALNGTATNYSAYALYFVKFAQAYASHDIPLYAFTMQNEGNFAPPNYPGCIWTSAQYAAFAPVLRAALDAAGFQHIQIWAGDCAWGSTADRVSGVLSNAAAAAALDGGCYHGYDGSPAQQLADMRPYIGKTTHMTEMCVPNNYSAADGTICVAGTFIIETIRAGASSVTFWNFLNGPFLGQNTTINSTNYPTITSPPISSQGVRPMVVTDYTGAITRHAEYVLFLEISKRLKPGARRCFSTTFGQGSDAAVQSLAFANPDGETILILFNNTTIMQAVPFIDAQTNKISSISMNAGDFVVLGWDASPDQKHVRRRSC